MGKRSALAALVASLAVAAASSAQSGPGWIPVRSAMPRDRMAVSFDSARDRVVAFGGVTQAETWEWDGARWQQLAPATNPPPRIDHAMAYDAARGRVVLYGGHATGSRRARAGTWEWDGVDWELRSAPTGVGPGPRRDHVMVWDDAGGCVLLVGGQLNNADANVWSWNGTGWTEYVAPGLTGVHTTAAAFDRARRKLIVWSPRASNQTWEWDAASGWVRMPQSLLTPPVVHGSRLAWDAVRRRVVWFGGLDYAGAMPRDTWEWDGVSWRQFATGPRPEARKHHAMTFDSIRGRVLVFGGLGPIVDRHENRLLSDAWSRSGTSWSQIHDNGHAPLREGAAMAHDFTTGHTVMFSGGTWPFFEDDTWEWDGSRWHRRFSPVRPIARMDYEIAHDIRRGRTVLFGGEQNVVPPDTSTYEWDGTTWSSHATVAALQYRRGAAMAYDASHSRCVLFGGIDGFAEQDDTWEWDGNAWVERFPANRPTPRRHHAMAFDLVRGRLVLFGGAVRGQPMIDDTWEWDGNTWSQMATAVRPPGRVRHAMAFDLTRNRVVLQGGLDSNGDLLGDTWEWDGREWVQTVEHGTPRSDHALTFDAMRGHTFAFGGTHRWDSKRPGEIYVTSAANARSMLAGCGSAVLTTSIPFLGNPALHCEIVGGARLTNGVLGWALQPARVTLGGGCIWGLGHTIASLPVTTNTAGFASTSLALPLDLALRDRVVWLQALVIDPRGPLAGLSFTGVRQLELGF